jgi:regulator of sigma E protease
MLFATLDRIRGRALPMTLIANTQSVFLVLLLSMILYVTVFGDFRRIRRDNLPAPKAPAAAPSKP